MRVAPYLLSALLLGTMLGTAHAAPATIEGSWSGSGIAKLRNRVDRMVCRVSFARIEGKSFRVSALCSTGGRRFEESGRVTSVGGNRYTGWVFNEQFNERGSVQLSQRGSRLSVTVTSSRGTANLTLSRG
ncbi:MAG: hypothetical protein WAM06_13730 [Methyloceanibacter sp.]